ncbi:hypothetical protein OIU84_023315 [Salix udensis]|uniref:Uncharacterized protein n=1 Tax=Salix udensis TaxID=889485 RepID=A0AAD6PEY3_9ROSI|nr:hypothetical protein OIU84_023315 [Salix udensis]
MADLQQQMKHIEDERLLVRSDIEKLKKKLENLTGTNPSSEEQLEAFHASIKEQLTKSRIVDITVTPLSKVPRFMRPTICSKRKSGTGYQTYEGRDDTVLERRRRPPSQRAESLSFPVKDRSDYNSDRSISRSSCLAELNMKISADNVTECSQDASETDFKSNVLQEQERAPRSLISQKAGISHIQKNSSRLVNKINHIKISKVDSWLHLQKSESTPSRCIQRTKRVSAVPVPEKKHKSNVQGKADDKVQGYVYTKQEVVNHDKLNNLATKGAVGKPLSEVVIEKPLKMLRDLFNEDSRSDVTTPLQTTGGETTTQIQHSADGLLTRDSEYDTSSPPDGCSPRLEECEGRKGVSAMSTTKAPGGKIQSSDSFLQAPTESNMEDSKTQGFYSFQPLEKETRHGLLQLKSQRALFMNSENRESLAVPFGKPEGKLQNTGICHVVKQTFEILCFSALLGLGLYNLGFDHDFFYGLML